MYNFGKKYIKHYQFIYILKKSDNKRKINKILKLL